MDKRYQAHALFFIIGLIFILIAQDFIAAGRSFKPIAYSEFRQHLEQGDIDTLKIGTERIKGTYKSPLPDGATGFTTHRVDPDLATELAQYAVTFDGEPDETWLTSLLSWLLPIMFVLAIWGIFLRRMTAGQGGLGGMMTLGKSKARVYVETETKVTFADVAGIDEAKDELKEVVAFLRDPQRYGRLGAHVPKGILLVGPPGTGKTLLARAVAGEAGVPFFSISGSEFVEMFVGVGAARVRDLFAQAAKTTPCIIFIDELDALGGARGLGLSGGHDEKDQTLNQLLTELDGFDTSSGIVLLAATNRPEILDPALLRAGRFDRQVLVDRPERKGRIAILNVHLKKISKLASDIDAEQIAALTPGFTGADLANLVNEAALLATRRDADAVTLDDFTRAVERIVAGLEKKSRVLNEHERGVVAHHEMGHALVAASLPGMDPVHKVSIIPRGVGALGYTIQRPTEERFLQTVADLKSRMAVLMGGRAAERLIFNEISTGAADDLAKVTDIARSMVTRFGMSDEGGQVIYEEDRQAFLGDKFGLARPKSYSEATARDIDAAVGRLVDDAFDHATQILTGRRNDLENGAAMLLERETLTVQDFPPMGQVTVSPTAPQPRQPNGNVSEPPHGAECHHHG
ncbi:ATP-dependent zinc metalloprotease FtsH [Halomonas sp. HP20-15]|uniref:ATP-dependent zinc metalloprotease FtsH n=1 Tax=Halomonas sp. HP20-15 TaxID=3085901 RepID=UPI0029827C02|nr:ATP-dependent zinc metalloprotease FtsH [Halomonas sp. HP20-15]MDW5377926.1 ATP-dependent zinc metalloprotease FtsH [Halomonas sp. HP20-15]